MADAAGDGSAAANGDEDETGAEAANGTGTGSAAHDDADGAATAPTHASTLECNLACTYTGQPMHVPVCRSAMVCACAPTMPGHCGWR